jgi:DNA-binding FadR family transcriptional regulator
VPWYRRDRPFHREITWTGGHPIFPAIVETLFGWASVYHHTIVLAEGTESLTLAEHQRIIDAIAQGHAEEAAICCI